MQPVLRTRDLLAHPAHFFALGFGTGLSRVAPGTVGSVLGLPLFLLLPSQHLPLYLLIVLLLFLFGLWCCDVTTRYLGVHDHSGIVWDEVVGMLLALTGAPASVLYLVLGFLLFRLFDIWKPWPIGWADKRVHGALGIMLDDVLAGLLACLSLHLIALFVVPLLISVFS